MVGDRVLALLCGGGQSGRHAGGPAHEVAAVQPCEPGHGGRADHPHGGGGGVDGAGNGDNHHEKDMSLSDTTGHCSIITESISARLITAKVSRVLKSQSQDRFVPANVGQVAGHGVATLQGEVLPSAVTIHAPELSD